MRRYASNYLYSPRKGWLRQSGVEISEGRIVRLFSVTEEIENTEWLPGVIMLSDDGTACHLYPFNFKEMQPVGETQRTQLL